MHISVFTVILDQFNASLQNINFLKNITDLKLNVYIL